jgi:phosphatidylserine/phosphatidylglycerophosphate/cardiolipin synthase-like enzyme
MKDRKQETTEASGIQHLHSRVEAHDVMADMMAQARRRIAIFAPTLDASLFNTSRVTQTLASFGAAHRRNLARLLVENSAQVVHDNGRVVELCRRFSDFIKMRQVDEDHAGLREMFVIIDDHAYLHQRDIDSPDFLAAVNTRRDVRPLILQYERMWDRSHAIPSILTAGL